MTIQEKINQEIKRCMIERDKVSLETLRSVKSAFLIEMTKDGSSSISDSNAESIIFRLVKQRRESADVFASQGRNDLEKEELDQLKVLESYLPEQMSEEEILDVIRDTVAELNLSSISQIGQLMSNLMPRLKGKADGKLISLLARRYMSR